MLESIGSKDVSTAAISMAVSKNQQDEDILKNDLAKEGIAACAINFGGEFITSVMKVVERAVVASKREGLINELHTEEGAVAGATREALSQIMPKALGLNVGGKIGIARCGDHISVCLYFGIGLLHLNEISIGLGHRVV